MPNYQEESAVRAAVRHPEATTSEEALLERVVGELHPLTRSEEPSLLRPQQHRNAVWRWHMRRKPRRP